MMAAALTLMAGSDAKRELYLFDLGPAVSEFRKALAAEEAIAFELRTWLGYWPELPAMKYEHVEVHQPTEAEISELMAWTKDALESVQVEIVLQEVMR